jgi:hypothetical protein
MLLLFLSGDLKETREFPLPRLYHISVVTGDDAVLIYPAQGNGNKKRKMSV